MARFADASAISATAQLVSGIDVKNVFYQSLKNMFFMLFMFSFFSDNLQILEQIIR